jgi:hypothetical protein
MKTIINIDGTLIRAAWQKQLNTFRLLFSSQGSEDLSIG